MRRSRRRGFTLMEMMAVLAVGTVLLGGATTMLFVTFRTTSSAASLLEHQRAFAQFELQFRRDAHDSTAAEVAASALIFKQADRGSIRYEQAGDAFERVQTGAAGQTVQRERYRVGIPLKAQWEITPGDRSMVTLSFAPATEPIEHGRMLRAVRIVAALEGSP
ncbi:MAG TPA: prepilin-type N-terminal cleavage/methylation domain-containing protein [Pirellulaceae bacterium]|nr:prepilin-type N-terminal cleavage/methylation domain-containing protein [Pirellulaceae bacterium]